MIAPLARGNIGNKQKALVSDSLTRAWVKFDVVRTGIEPVFHP